MTGFYMAKIKAGSRKPSLEATATDDSGFN